jgi:hypothetical protein
MRLQERYDTLMLEPFGKTREEILGMTSTTIDNLLRAGQRQAEAFRRETSPPPQELPPEQKTALTGMEKRAEEGVPPTFEELWHTIYKFMMDEPTAKRQYQKQLADWHARRAKKEKGNGNGTVR